MHKTNKNNLKAYTMDQTQVPQPPEQQVEGIPEQVSQILNTMLSGVQPESAAAIKSMAAMLVALVPALTQSKQGKGLALKAGTLPTFDGSKPMELYNFFQQAEIHFLAHNEDINSPSSLAKLSTYFSEGALQFLVGRLPNITMHGWQYFKNAFLQQYGLFTNFQASIHALLNLCSGPQDNYHTYVQTFNNLLAVITHYRPSYDKELFCIIFRRGLPVSVQAVAAEFMENDIYDLQTHINSRIIRNPALARQTGVSSSHTGPTPMDLGFAKSAKIHNVEHVGADKEESFYPTYESHDDNFFDGDEAEVNVGFTSKGKPYRGGYKFNNTRGGHRGGHSNRGGGSYRGGRSQQYSRAGYHNTNSQRSYSGPQSHKSNTNTKSKFTPDGKPICNYCGIPGHIQKDCRKLKYAQQQGRVHTVEVDQSPHDNHSAPAPTHIQAEPFLAM